MDVLKRWRVWCETEGAHVETLQFAPPRTCPNNARHAIDFARTELIGQEVVDVRAQHVAIASKSTWNTTGYYMLEGMEFHVPPGVERTVYDIPIDFPQCVYGMHVTAHAENEGDRFSVILNPGTPLGGLLEEAPAGSRALAVPGAATRHVTPGFFVEVGGEEARVVGTSSNGILLSGPLQQTHAAGTPLLLNVHIVRDFIIGCAGCYDIGYGSMGGKPLPAGAMMQLRYTSSNTAVPKHLTVNYEYTY